MASPRLHSNIQTPQNLGVAFCACRVTPAKGLGDRGSLPPFPEPKGWRKGKALAGMGPRGLSPTTGSCRAQMDVPSVQDGSKEFVLMVWRMGMGRGISVWGWEPGRLDPMEWLRLSTAGGN